MQRTPHPIAWDDVRFFLALYRSATMGAAAKLLGVDPATVSRRLVSLEEELDTVLFERGRNGLHATEAAHDLAPSAELVENGVAQFTHAAEGLEREVEGLVRIACPPDAAEVLVLPALEPLLAEHPKLRVTILPGEAVVDLNRREADISMRIVRPERGDLVFKRLLEVPWVPAASPALAAEVGELRDEKLREVRWLGMGPDLAQTPFGQWLETYTGDEPILRTDSITAHIAAASLGIGASLIPEPSVVHYGLNILPLAEGHPARRALPRNDLWLITHRALRNVPRIRAVWDALTEFADIPLSQRRRLQWSDSDGGGE